VAELVGAELGWYVRITLPHREQIRINEFKTEAAAINWIASNAAAWLKKLSRGRYA
jgi:hypothetical protein